MFALIVRVELPADPALPGVIDAGENEHFKLGGRFAQENSTCQWCGALMTETTDGVRWDKPCTHGQHILGHAEEWAIHDYEGFGALRLGEWESLERVAAKVAMLSGFGPPAKALVSPNVDLLPS